MRKRKSPPVDRANGRSEVFGRVVDEWDDDDDRGRVHGWDSSCRSFVNFARGVELPRDFGR